MKGKLDDYGSELAQMVQIHKDATLSEYCEYFGVVQLAAPTSQFALFSLFFTFFNVFLAY
ncbi:MAG: hypothetical protein WBA07_08180 [Rivularia sp. (in: cyanobacteria)]